MLTGVGKMEDYFDALNKVVKTVNNELYSILRNKIRDCQRFKKEE